jgi:hypothetical protein
MSWLQYQQPSARDVFTRPNPWQLIITECEVEQSQAKSILQSLTMADKALLCARLCHALTVIGRAAFETQAVDVRIERIRALNEIQHQATGILAEVLENQACSVDDRLATLFCGKRTDKFLEVYLTDAFERVSRSIVNPSA